MISSLKKVFTQPNLGLLIIRFTIGPMMIAHGLAIFMGGSSMMKMIGSNLELIGISFLPVVWGFMASAIEVLGGLLFAIGFFFRPACFLLTFTMVIATLHHLDAGDSFVVTSHAAKTACIFFGMLFVGAGTLSFDKD